MTTSATDSPYDVATRIWDGRWHLVAHSKLPEWLQDNDFLVNWHRIGIVNTGGIRVVKTIGHQSVDGDILFFSLDPSVYETILDRLFQVLVIAFRPFSVGTQKRVISGPI